MTIKKIFVFTVFISAISLVSCADESENIVPQPKDGELQLTGGTDGLERGED